jgi:signal transduction histidine kinase
MERLELDADLARPRVEDVVSEAGVRAPQLLAITSALADAVASEEVLEAVVDRVASAVAASSTAVWLVDESGRSARLARQIGYHPAAARSLQHLPLDLEPSIPAIDAIRRREPVWVMSQAALVDGYPHLAALVTPGRSYRVSCLPLIANGKTLGSLALTIEQEATGPVAIEEERSFLLLVARFASQAIERLRLLDAERRARADAHTAAEQIAQLYRFAQAAVSSDSLDQALEAALDTICDALAAPRAAVLIFDQEQVMRFRAWRGLSDGYRQAVDGHSPWLPDTPRPDPMVVPDVASEPTLASLRSVLQAEGIASLAFFPLVTRGQLIGKLMIYHREPHLYSATELELAAAISNHLASVIARFSAVAELERTIHYNELFAGVLAHDLRNPLLAITTSAQLVLMRFEGEGDRTARPLSRILSSGHRMARMIDELLDFTRARVAGGIQIQRRSCELAELCAQAIGELELVYPDCKYECSFSGDTRGDWDPDRLIQVISNLVANASQHGEPEHEIVIRADGHAADAVVIEVRNHGCIPPRLLPELFDPFRGSRDRSAGVGLGLFIVRELVRAHAGTVDVRSSADAGTTFVIRLPRAAPG